MSYLRKSPQEWLSADVTVAQSDLERRLTDQMLQAAEPPTVLELSAGADFVKEGFLATSVYLVLAGELSVSVDGDEVARLGPGSVFGELAILSNRQRKATVTAVSETSIAVASEYAVSRDDLQELAATRQPGSPHGEDAP